MPRSIDGSMTGRRHLGWLARTGLLLAAAAGAVLHADISSWSRDAVERLAGTWAAGWGTIAGAALAEAATGALAAWIVASARHGAHGPVAEKPSLASRRAGWLAKGPQAVLVAGGGLLAAGLAASLIRLPGAAPAAPAPLWLPAAALAAVFPLLLAERHLAGLDPSGLPEAPALARLVRVPILAVLGFALAALLAASGLGHEGWVRLAAALLVAAVGTELAARGAAMLFLPFPPPDQPRLLARSEIARLIGQRPSLLSVGHSVQRQLGIDLERSWALSFLRRAALPAAACLVLAGWAVTGITALPLDRRAVYLRLGEPVAVLGPGLHLHLPWPFGVLRPVEFGVLHAVGTAARGNVPPSPADGPTPPSLDRLWGEAHPSEVSFLVASGTDGRLGFQVVEVDLRLVFRVGLSDADALAALGNAADPAALVRAATGRALGHVLASRTLLQMLGEDLGTLSDAMRTELRAELDALHAGLDVVAVVIEAVHPPTGAAVEYHAVQTAELQSQVAVAEEKARAADTMATTEAEAQAALARAAGLGADLVAQARRQAILFAGEQDADAAGPRPYRTERWFEHLKAALQNRRLLLLDHRLAGAGAPTIDLRDFAAPGGLVRNR